MQQARMVTGTRVYYRCGSRSSARAQQENAMLKWWGGAAAAMLMSVAAAWAGDPVGRYSIVGSNPGSGTKYAGTVTVERTGDTFRVTWDIGNQTYVGTGIGSDK